MSATGYQPTTRETPWQLRMFDKTLKKKQRFKVLCRMLGDIDPNEQCLLVTCGDNNGAINHHLRGCGGTWSWADLEDTSIEEMSQLLEEDVLLASDDHLPFPDNYFHRTVSIDVLEHIADPNCFARELMRVTRPNGRVLITVPGGDGRKVANRVKNALGMTKEAYGHIRDGYSVEELEHVMQSSGLQPVDSMTFSRFFTEMIELGINYLYVKKLSKNNECDVNEGTIAPATQEQLKSVDKAYRIYSLVYPFVWMMSQLDIFIRFTRGYVVLVEGRKREE